MFLLFSFVLVAAVVEVGLRLFHPIPFPEFMEYEVDGHIRVRPLPGQSVTNRAGYAVRTNREGFRGPDYALEKPRGTLRIQVYGGSAAFDFEASTEEKSWPGALQRILSEKLKMPVEVMNLAVPGYDSFNNKINYLYTGRNYHPDAAIMYETWNDMSRYRELAKAPYRSGASQPNKPLWQKIARMSQIGRHAQGMVRSITGRRLDDVTKVQTQGAGELDAAADPKALDWDRQNFVDFVEFTSRDGVLPILSSMAFLGSEESLKTEQVRQIIAEGCVQRGFTPARALETLLRMSSIIREVATNMNAIFVDGYSAVPHDLDHVRDNVHLHDAGSAKLAQAMAETLLKDPRFQKVVEKVRRE